MSQLKKLEQNYYLNFHKIIINVNKISHEPIFTRIIFQYVSSRSVESISK